MTKTTSQTGAILDPQDNPYMGYEHVVQRTAYMAENNASLSVTINRLLIAAALVVSAHGVITGNKASTVAGGALALAHVANARFSRKREELYRSAKDIVTYSIAARPEHPNAANMEKPSKLELTSFENQTIGGLHANSLKERSVKLGVLALDFAALGGLSYLSGNPASALGVSVLGLYTAHKAYKLISESRKPAEELGESEVRDFMKVGQPLLVYRSPKALA